jgi:hypothetical protein
MFFLVCRLIKLMGGSAHEDANELVEDAAASRSWRQESAVIADDDVRKLVSGITAMLEPMIGKAIKIEVERSDRSVDEYSRASSEPAEARVVVSVARKSLGCLS